MKRTLLIPAIVSVSLATGASFATAGTVFDFIPRMDFVEQPETVTKDKSGPGYICDASLIKSGACSAAVKSAAPELPKPTKN